MSELFVDVSSNNHDNNEPIDWKLVHEAGYRGAIIKCSEGLEYKNPWAERDANGAFCQGMQIGYYHFARPGLNDAVEEAQYAIDTVAGLHRTIGISLDLEVRDGLTWPDLQDWGIRFTNHIASKNIISPWYSNLYFLSNMPLAPHGHKLWIAEPSQRPRRECWMWQKSSTTIVPGIPGETDINVYYGP